MQYPFTGLLYKREVHTMLYPAVNLRVISIEFIQEFGMKTLGLDGVVVKNLFVNWFFYRYSVGFKLNQ